MKPSLTPATGSEIRRRARQGELTGPTPGLALGFVQANLVIVPRDLAFDFLLFCQRNPKPCPLLDVTEPGSAEPRFVATGADLRTDLPRYRVYQNGELVDEPHDLSCWWRRPCRLPVGLFVHFRERSPPGWPSRTTHRERL